MALRVCYGAYGIVVVLPIEEVRPGHLFLSATRAQATSFVSSGAAKLEFEQWQKDVAARGIRTVAIKVVPAAARAGCIRELAIHQYVQDNKGPCIPLLASVVGSNISHTAVRTAFHDVLAPSQRSQLKRNLDVVASSVDTVASAAKGTMDLEGMDERSATNRTCQAFLTMSVVVMEAYTHTLASVFSNATDELLSSTDVLDVLMCVGRAIDKLRVMGVEHRDLTPYNIMLKRDRNCRTEQGNFSVAVSDWGLSVLRRRAVCSDPEHLQAAFKPVLPPSLDSDADTVIYEEAEEAKTDADPEAAAPLLLEGALAGGSTSSMCTSDYRDPTAVLYSMDPQVRLPPLATDGHWGPSRVRMSVYGPHADAYAFAVMAFVCISFSFPYFTRMMPEKHRKVIEEARYSERISMEERVAGIMLNFRQDVGSAWLARVKASRANMRKPRHLDLLVKAQTLVAEANAERHAKVQAGTLASYPLSPGMRELRRTLRLRFSTERRHAPATTLILQLVDRLLVVNVCHRLSIAAWLQHCRETLASLPSRQSPNRFAVVTPLPSMRPVLLYGAAPRTTPAKGDHDIVHALMDSRREGCLPPLCRLSSFAQIMNAVSKVVSDVCQSDFPVQMDGTALVVATSNLFRSMFRVDADRRRMHRKPTTRRKRCRSSSVDSFASTSSTCSAATGQVEEVGDIVRRYALNPQHPRPAQKVNDGKTLQKTISNVYMRLALAGVMVAQSSVFGTYNYNVSTSLIVKTFVANDTPHMGRLVDWVAAIAPWVPVWLQLRRPRPRLHRSAAVPPRPSRPFCHQTRRRFAAHVHGMRTGTGGCITSRRGSLGRTGRNEFAKLDLVEVLYAMGVALHTHDEEDETKTLSTAADTSVRASERHRADTPEVGIGCGAEKGACDVSSPQRPLACARLLGEPECLCERPLPFAMRCSDMGGIRVEGSNSQRRMQRDAKIAFACMFMCGPSAHGMQDVNIPCILCPSVFTSTQRMKRFVFEMKDTITTLLMPDILKALSAASCTWAQGVVDQYRVISVKPDVADQPHVPLPVLQADRECFAKLCRSGIADDKESPMWPPIVGPVDSYAWMPTTPSTTTVEAGTVRRRKRRRQGPRGLVAKGKAFSALRRSASVTILPV